MPTSFCLICRSNFPKSVAPKTRSAKPLAVQSRLQNPNDAKWSNEVSSATAATRRADCNRDGPPPFAAAHLAGLPKSELPNPTWRIRPLREEFSMCKGLICKGGPLSKHAKVAVVKTYHLPTRDFLCRINGHYVFALHQAKEEWQGTLLLERRRKQTLYRS